MLGTTSQLVAIGIVVYELLSSPDPEAKTEIIRTTGNFERQLVAVMNMIFAFGGQFAFTELMTDMSIPAMFPRAIAVCTACMTTLYVALASAGYWSRGLNVADLCIFSLGRSNLACFAAACILVQALAQYLVNLNVWTHNLLVLLGRCRSRGSQRIVSADATSAADHAWLPWLLASLFVVAYSYVISMSVPYFSSLVGIVAGTTYLVCAYTLPCWFALRLFGPEQMSKAERWLCRGLIPLSLLVSALGLASSVKSLVDDIREKGSGFGPAA